jgi:hypothetical protein
VELDWFWTSYLGLGALCMVYVFEALVVAGVVTNDWMHLNVAWRSRWLE